MPLEGRLNHSTIIQSKELADQKIQKLRRLKNYNSPSTEGQKRSQNLAPVLREGANREKLTVKKRIDNEMFFFFHRSCPFLTVKNRRKP